jgi:flagellar biosynthetic protein FliQ
MSMDLVVELYREMLRTAAFVATPILGTAMFIGLAVSLLQTVTSINEQTLTFVPKIAGIAIVVGITLPWILTQLMGFLTLILSHAPGLVIGP